MRMSKVIGSVTAVVGSVLPLLSVTAPLLAGALLFSASDANASHRWRWAYEPNNDRWQAERYGRRHGRGQWQFHYLDWYDNDYSYFDSGPGHAWSYDRNWWHWCSWDPDPRMWMYDRHGRHLGYNDNSCAAMPHIGRNVGGGRFFFRNYPYCYRWGWWWFGWTICKTGYYQWYMNYPPNISPDRYEPDNSWTQARNRGRRFGHPRSDEPHNYHHNGDNDYVQIHVPTSGRIELWTKGNNNSNSCRPDTYLHLYNSGGGHLVSNDDGGGGLCSRIVRTHWGGRTYFYARSHSYAHRYTGNYRFHYRFTELPRWTSGPHHSWDDNNAQLRIWGSYNTSSAGWVYVYRAGQSYSVGGNNQRRCRYTSQYKGRWRVGGGRSFDLRVGGANWIRDNDAWYSNYYGARNYCWFVTMDNGLGGGSTHGWPRVASANGGNPQISVDQANANVAVTMAYDRPSVGWIKLHRGGNTNHTHGGIWHGNHCSQYHTPFGNGTGGAYRIVHFNSLSSSWRANFTNLPRGYKYCVEVFNNRNGRHRDQARRWWAVMTPHVGWATITSIDLRTSHANTPQFAADVRLSSSAPIRAYLYRGGYRSGNSCRNGTKVHGPWDRGAADRHYFNYTNSRNWHKIQRGEFYCLQVTTRDGGNRQAADSTTAPNAGFAAFTGSVNQNNADFYINADWHGNAGDASYLSFYRDNDCRSARLYRYNIPWNGGGESRNWNQRNVEGIVRGYNYCAEVRLGRQRRIFRYGQLQVPRFSSVNVSADQRRAVLRVRADWTYQAESVVTLYRGGAAQNNVCNNHQGVEASRGFGQSRAIDWEFRVSRGYRYCVYIYLKAVGVNPPRVYARHSEMSPNILRVPTVQNFTVTGVAAGGAVHAYARVGDTERWEAMLFRGAVDGNSCSGQQVARVTNTDAGFHGDRIDWMHSRVRRRTQHCVKVVAHNGVLNTARAASVAGLPTTVTGAGYTANMTSERTWDEITDLNPGRMRDRDDATASVALGFDFIYFGRYQNRVAISTNGWFSFGDNNVDSDPVPAAWGAAGDRPHLVAPLFANLYCDGVYWKRVTAPPERFVITWDCRERGAAPHAVDFQAVLYRGLNRVEFRYRDAHYAQFSGGGRVKVGMSSDNQYVPLSNNLLPAAGGEDGKVLYRNPAYEEYLPRITGPSVSLDQRNATVQVRFTSTERAFLRAKLFRGGNGNNCSGGFYLRNIATPQKATDYNQTFDNLVRGHAYCIRMEAENTAGVAVKGLNTPVLQLIPRILGYDARIRVRANASRTVWEAESLPAAGAGTCGPSGDGVNHCRGGGGSEASFSVPEAGTYILSARLGAEQAGSDLLEAGFVVDGNQVGENTRIVGHGWGEMQWYQTTVELAAGEHTYRTHLMNDWAGEADQFGRTDRNMLVDKLAVEGPFVVNGTGGNLLWNVTPNTDVQATMTLRHGNQAIGTENLESIGVNGSGQRTYPSAQLTAGRDYTVNIRLENLAGSVETGWQLRRFPFTSGESVANIDKARNAVTVVFSSTPGAFGQVQYKAAGRFANGGCDGGGWSAINSVNQAMDNHRLTLSNLVDGMHYCWRAVTEYPRGAPYRTVVTGPSQTFVFDKTPPTVTAPPYVILEQENLQGTVVNKANLGLPEVRDLVDKRMSATNIATPEVIGRGDIPNDGIALQLGTHHVRWRASDSAGNVGYSGLQRVDVRDTTRPTFAAGPALVVEATSPQGTQITPKSLHAETANGTQFRGWDACDAELAVTQTSQQDGEGDWLPAADVVYQRSSNPGGVGNHTVRVLMRDDSGNSTVGTYEVTIQDTTAPTFSPLPTLVVGDDESDCVTSYIPRPRISDNSYFPHELTVAPDKGDDFCWATSDAQGTRIPGPGGRVEGSIIVHDVTWTGCDPAQNCREQIQRVEVRRPTLAAEHTITVGGRAVEMGTYVNGTVTVRTRLTRFSNECGDPRNAARSVWLPEPDQVDDGGEGEFIGLYTSDGDYLGTNVQLWHCDEFALVPNLTFGKDTILPEHDMEALDQASVNPENIDSWPRLFVGNKLDLGNMTVSDDRSGVRFIRVMLNPGQGGEEASEWGRELVLMQRTIAGSGRLIHGPAEVTDFACREGAAPCVMVDGRPHLDLTKLRTFDRDQVRQHVLRIEILDFAGNRTIDDRYFLLRDYKRALTDVAGRIETALLDAADEEYQTDLDEAKSHLEVALSYWEAKTGEGIGPDFSRRQIQWGPSFRRSERGVVSLSRARRNDAPSYFRILETDISQAMIGQMQLYLDEQEGLLNPPEGQDPNEDEIPAWWDETLADARATLADARAQAYGRTQADRAADAYNDAAALYELRYDHLQRVTERTVAADESEDPIEDGELRDLVYALNNIIHSVIKEEIRSAREVNNAGGDQLDVVIRRLNQVQGCMDRLVRDNLNDRTFTLCYLDIVEIVHQLRQVQGALVETYTWRSLLAASVFGMLDISIYHSINALVTFEGYDENPEAIEALEQYRLGTEELRAGDVDVALNRYLANRCRMVVLYNEYYADPEDPSLGPINEADYCED